jgi:hypothetical protein
MLTGPLQTNSRAPADLLWMKPRLWMMAPHGT